MAKWLVPPSSGKIYTNASGRVYTGTANVPVSFEDADAAGAVADGWSYASTNVIEPAGKLINPPASYSLDSAGKIKGLSSTTGTIIQTGYDSTAWPMKVPYVLSSPPTFTGGVANAASAIAGSSLRSVGENLESTNSGTFPSSRAATSFALATPIRKHLCVLRGTLL